MFNFKQLKLKQWDLIEITWIDALSGGEGWVWLSDIDWEIMEKKMIHQTVGYFIKETPKMIAVCQSYRTEKEQGGEREGDYSVETPTEIPKVAILKIEKKKKKTVEIRFR